MNLQTPLATKVVGGAALLLVAALGWLLLVGPTWSAIGEAETARTDAADANTLLTSQLADLRAQAQDLTRTSESAAELAQILPATADQPGFFADVTEAAQDAGIEPGAIDDLSLSVPVVATDPAAAPTGAATEGTDTDAAGTDASTPPSEPAAPTDPSTTAFQTVSLSVTASYAELQGLLANLETMPRALVVTGLSVTRGEGDDLTLALEGATFVAPPLVAPQAAPEQAGPSAGTATSADAG